MWSNFEKKTKWKFTVYLMSLVEKSSKNNCLSDELEIQIRGVLGLGLCYLNLSTIEVEYIIVKRKFQNKVHTLDILFPISVISNSK